MFTQSTGVFSALTYRRQRCARIAGNDLRISFEIALQDTWFYNISIKENAHYGRLTATDEEMFTAAKIAEQIILCIRHRLLRGIVPCFMKKQAIYGKPVIV